MGQFLFLYAMHAFVPSPLFLLRIVGTKQDWNAKDIDQPYVRRLLNKLKQPGRWFCFFWLALPLETSAEIAKHISAGSFWIWPLLTLWLLVIPAIMLFVDETTPWRQRSVLRSRTMRLLGSIFTADNESFSFEGPNISVKAHWSEVKDYRYVDGILNLRMQNDETYSLPRRLFSTEDFADLRRYLDPPSEEKLPPLSVPKARLHGHEFGR